MSGNESDINNSGFADHVRAALRADVVEVTASPAMLAGVRRRYARRKAAHRLAMVATPTAVVAAVGAGVAFAPGAITAPQTEGGTVDVAYVTTRTSQALLGVTNDILYEHATDTSGDKFSKPGQTEVVDHWITGDRSALRARITVSGSVVSDMSVGRDGGVEVAYSTHTWDPLPKPNHGIDAPDVLTPAEIRQGLAAGSIRVVGPGQPINGHATVVLHRDATPGSEPVDLWVDQSTYLPVQSKIDGIGTLAYSITWLSPTTENLALLNAPVPSGFQRG
jgi:hypothetical protein